ncbi:MAG: glycosyltransferase [Proteobacteria bacterium]|nr:glycosyltransferase [Pseudomonadota bacterium]
MTARPKLLVTTSTFPRWAGDTEPGFVQYLSLELAKIYDVVVLAPHCAGAARQEVLARDGLQVDVRRYRYGIDAFETLAYGGGMLARARSRPLRLLLLPFFLAAQFLAIRRLQKESDFDAIHAHWIIPQGIVAALLSRLSRRFPPLLVTSHGGDLYALRGRFLEAVKHWVLRRADAVSVVSRAMRDECVRLGVVPERIVVQSMGVDLDTTFTPGDPEAVRDGLVFVGRLVDKKGLTHLVAAMSILARRFPDLYLRIVGDGPLRETLIGQARNSGVLDKMTFVGSVPNTDVPQYLRAAKIAVMPSVVAPSGDQEGLGLVAVEAQGCGCAVVASDLPAVRDTILDGRTGLMAKPADGADLAEKIAKLLDDDTLRQTLAAAGRRHAIENFNWRAVGASYAGIIAGMIGASRAR